MTAPARRWTPFDRAAFVVMGLLVAGIVVLALLANRSTAEAGLRIAFLYPADGVQNIHVAPLDDPEAARQVSFAELGVYNYDVSADGRFIIAAIGDPATRLTDLYRIDLMTIPGAAPTAQRLTACAEAGANCRTPAIRYDNRRIAYERAVDADPITGGPGAIRIWILDLETSPPSTYPLFSDQQVVGYGPAWSADGSRISLFSADINNLGILVVDFAAVNEADALRFISSNQGSTGDLAPNGRQLVFPSLSHGGGEQLVSFLRLWDLEPNTVRSLTDPGQPIDDIAGIWHPDGERMAITRRYTDDRWTRGYQVYLLDGDGDVSPLSVDARYSHGFISWDPAGGAILTQRYPLLTETGDAAINAQPEVWVASIDGEAARLVPNAFFPQWVPAAR
jgi:Tol biopolymer transport system component